MPKCHSTAEQVHGNMVFKMGAPSWIMQCRLKTFPRMVTLVWSPELENTLRCCCRTALISQHAETIACLLLQDKARLHCWGREVWFHLFTCESFFHIFPLPPVTLTISLPFLLFYLSLFFFLNVLRVSSAVTTLKIRHWETRSVRGCMCVPICVSTCNEHHMCVYQSPG